MEREERRAARCVLCALCVDMGTAAAAPPALSTGPVCCLHRTGPHHSAHRHALEALEAGPWQTPLTPPCPHPCTPPTRTTCRDRNLMHVWARATTPSMHGPRIPSRNEPAAPAASPAAAPPPPAAESLAAAEAPAAAPAPAPAACSSPSPAQQRPQSAGVVRTAPHALLHLDLASPAAEHGGRGAPLPAHSPSSPAPPRRAGGGGEGAATQVNRSLRPGEVLHSRPLSPAAPPSAGAFRLAAASSSSLSSAAAALVQQGLVARPRPQSARAHGGGVPVSPRSGSTMSAQPREQAGRGGGVVARMPPPVRPRSAVLLSPSGVPSQRARGGAPVGVV